MRALLTDLDRTLTGPDLVLDPRVPRVLGDLRVRGVRVVVVTGRSLDYVRKLALPADAIVAENGAVVGWPDGRSHVEAPDFPHRCRDALGGLAAILRWGQVIGSGAREAAPTIASALRAAGIAHALSFNAEEVMLLPPGVDKASGARSVLRHLGVHPRDALAIGDGENDVPMLRLAGRSAAPANAHHEARTAASSRLRGAYADGLVEAVRACLAHETV